MCAEPHRLAAEQETRHGRGLSRTALHPAARLQLTRDRRRRRLALPPLGRSAHRCRSAARPRSVADVPGHSGPSRRVGPHRVSQSRGAVGRGRGRHPAADDERRLPLRACDDRCRSGRRPGRGAARPRASPRARARRRTLGDHDDRRQHALREDRVQGMPVIAALLRHQRRNRDRLSDPARAARRATGATRAGSSSGPSRRATSLRSPG